MTATWWGDRAWACWGFSWHFTTTRACWHLQFLNFCFKCLVSLFFSFNESVSSFECVRSISFLALFVSFLCILIYLQLCLFFCSSLCSFLFTLILPLCFNNFWVLWKNKLLFCSEVLLSFFFFFMIKLIYLGQLVSLNNVPCFVQLMFFLLQIP